MYKYITPATLVAYCLECIYTFMLMNDARLIRLNTSQAGEQFISQDSRDQFINAMSWRAVPPFVFDIIKGMYSTFDPRRNNVAYITSFAAFSLDHDFYRVFPITMFLKLHDIIAEKSRTMNATQAYDQWIQTSVITGGTTLQIGNIIGTGINGIQVDNYLNTRIRSLFNILNVQSNTRRPVYQRIATTPYETRDTPGEINGYIYLLGADSMNLSTVNTVMENLSHSINNLFTGCSLLGEIFSLESGVSLLNHYYVGPSLPTGHRSEIKPFASKGTLTDFARTIKFMQPRTNNFKTEIKYPAATTEFEPKLYAYNNAQTNTDNPDPGLDFDVKLNYQPDILLCSPWSTGISSMYHPVTNGIHIEISTIDVSSTT